MMVIGRRAVYLPPPRRFAEPNAPPNGKVVFIQRKERRVFVRFKDRRVISRV